MKITKGKYTLEHTEYRDYIGVLRDGLTIFDEETRTYYPFSGKMKVRSFSKSSNVLDDRQGYTIEDLKEMLDEMIVKIEEKNEFEGTDRKS